MTKQRSYQRLVNDIINLKIPFRVEILDYVSYNPFVYPIIAIRHITKTAKKNCVILAGHHGDETFVIHVLLKWIQQIDKKLLNTFNFNIIPVINPSGYETGTRLTAKNQDTNNAASFVKNSSVKELAILFDNLPSTVDLMIDFHGDTDRKFSYAYERKIDTLPSLAGIALQEVDSILPYDKSKTIYRSKVEKGVITTPKNDEGIEAVMETMGTESTITIELPGKFDSQRRTEGGIAILNSIFYHYKEIQ